MLSLRRLNFGLVRANYPSSMIQSIPMAYIALRRAIMFQVLDLRHSSWAGNEESLVQSPTIRDGYWVNSLSLGIPDTSRVILSIPSSSTVYPDGCSFLALPSPPLPALFHS